MKATTTTNGIHPAAKVEHARHAESTEKRKPKANWAWADGSRHFDWMDWHTHSALSISTGFDL
ncbi:hypothetical protein FVF58_17400 [Paraburkholderia panacisoli]|uniref:Uncharacterized protein n=1 Tax=Paraburkholderia panacisoli TaxID=2603818 RepID=A0A5B0H7P7_9BURK|nr:hypothetical protein [Paraburkholderia panacisoli]KAA1011161.1 hypothetical protein FVF58_17400 [Paraburkholderia panacisoli]